MREIKVRGYAVDEMVGSQWVYGTGIHRTVFTEEFAKECGQSGETFIWTGRGWVLVHDESVGQYTGLKDKNGKEIYEGDIVRWRRVLYTDCWETEVKEVQIRTCEIGYLCDIDLGLFMYNEEYDSLIFKPLAVIEDKDGFEIIGNIYENPELSEALS